MMFGLGYSPGEKCYDPNRPSWVPFWLNTPTEIACLWGKLGSPSEMVGEAYEQVQYGSIPDITHVPGLVCPEGTQQTDPFGDDFCSPTMAGAYGQTVHEQEIIAGIEEAEGSGAWVPSGKLPLTADWLDKYKWPLLLGGGVVVVLLLRR